jgi:hypothetical protein
LPFIEKEDFFRCSMQCISERFDLAIMKPEGNVEHGGAQAGR